MKFQLAINMERISPDIDMAEVERHTLAVKDRGRPDQEDEPSVDASLDAPRLTTGRHGVGYFVRGHRSERLQ